jgi:hypothetical protein
MLGSTAIRVPTGSAASAPVAATSPAHPGPSVTGRRAGYSPRRMCRSVLSAQPIAQAFYREAPRKPARSRVGWAPAGEGDRQRRRGCDEPGTRLRVRLTIHTYRATITQHLNMTHRLAVPSGRLWGKTYAACCHGAPPDGRVSRPGRPNGRRATRRSHMDSLHGSVPTLKRWCWVVSSETCTGSGPVVATHGRRHVRGTTQKVLPRARSSPCQERESREAGIPSRAFPLCELGAMAARMILQMAQGQPPQEHVVFPFQIHVRASSVRG